MSDGDFLTESRRSRGLPPVRSVTNVDELRALSHPTRLALLEVLYVKGGLTATQAAPLVGESPSSCSFHLRTLAKYGFVEETGEGKGRERPWKVVDLGMTMDSKGTAEESVAKRALFNIFFQRSLDRWRAFQDDQEKWGPGWTDASGSIEYASWMTQDELKQVSDAIMEILESYVDRIVDPSKRPDGSELVEMVFLGYPVGEGFRDLPRSASGDEPAGVQPPTSSTG